ncbi:hypothetical protein C8F04DRAFT_1229225 [Mycena alexandri]|uniref:BTB domain-containing protein n=1 Tax=Mycena alexandri TaxID=1745969 RepID=A0AAD6TBY6_9AGAR|nr:hypothetical protein C8F04DRAFT_1229225 [Mycena alexandri]
MSLSDSSATEGVPIVRSDIWYSDGSVVLQAQNTQWRVHWSLLGQHSAFFRDMQALPQPPDQPTVEGCPVVELHDDVADVHRLLRVLYSPTIAPQKVIRFDVVAALIRLGRKYEFRALLNSAVQRITFENPTTLKEYDAREPSFPGNFIGYRGIEYDMLALARENNIMTALPCAYYRVLRCSTHKELFDGLGGATFLAPADQRQCNLSREKLIMAQMGCLGSLGWLWDWDSHGTPPDCKTPDMCSRVRAEAARGYHNSVEVRALESTDTGSCSVCFSRIKNGVRQARLMMWAHLPTYCDLPRWKELKNDL